MNKKFNRTEKYDILMGYIDRHSSFIMNKLKKQFTDEDIVEYEDESLGFDESDKNRRIPFQELLRKVLLFESTKLENDALYNYIAANDKETKNEEYNFLNVLKELAENDKFGAPNSVSAFDDYQGYINSIFAPSGERIIKVEFVDGLEDKNTENIKPKIR